MSEHIIVPEPYWFRTIAKVLRSKRGKYFIVLFWFFCLILGLVFGPSFPVSTKTTISAPRGSRAHNARSKLHKSFPTRTRAWQTMIYFTCHDKQCYNDDGEAVAINDESLPLRNITARLRESLLDYNRTGHHHQVYNISDYYNAVRICNDYTETDTNGAQERQGCIESANEEYIGGDNSQSALMTVRTKRLIPELSKQIFLRWLDKRIHNVNRDYHESSGIKVKLSGHLPIIYAMQQEGSDTFDNTMFLLPLLLIIQAYVLRSIRLVFLPLSLAFVVLSFSFALLYPIAVYILAFPPNAPSIGMAIGLAMSLDYTLLLLVRFGEELRASVRDFDGSGLQRLNYRSVERAMLGAIRWSGEVVNVSGAIVVISQVLYLFFPTDFLRGIGFCCAVCVGVAIVCVMTLVPALVLIFPGFFTVFGFGGFANNEIYYPDDELESLNHASSLKSSADEQNSDEEAAEMDWLNPQKIDEEARSLSSLISSDKLVQTYEGLLSARAINENTVDLSAMSWTERRWYRTGAFVTKWPQNCFVICALYLVMLPFVCLVFTMKIQYGQNLFIPRDCEYYKTYKSNIRSDFVAGSITPLYMVVTMKHGASDNASVWDYEYINDTATIVKSLSKTLNGTKAEIDGVFGVSVAGSTYLNEDGESAYRSNYDESQLYHAQIDEQVASDNRRSYFTIMSSTDPTGYHMKKIVQKTRHEMRQTCKRHGYSCYLSSINVEYTELIHTITSTFPILLAGTIVVILGYAGWMFDSLISLPLRLAATIIFPIAFMWGVFLLVYQYGILNWMHWAAMSDSRGVQWLIPIMGTALLIALALDYDLFFYTRVHEYHNDRRIRMPLRAAIINAMCTTGDTITSAGIIMTIAFCPLFMSGDKGLNQIGFVLCVGVLFDTFVIRTLLVPAILSITFEERQRVWDPEWKEWWESKKLEYPSLNRFR
jgi:uncharacterized membrane protein YdfJ with MMPL/SSD domain